MSTPNAQFLNVWKREAAHGTDVITLATDQTYKFGLYPPKTKIDTVTQKAVIEAIRQYNARQPASQVVAYWEHATQVLPTYYPVNAQALHRIFGTATDAATDTITCLDTGYPNSFTWRQELYGGTNPHRRQMRGCFTTGLDIDMIAHKPMEFKETIRYWGIKDQGDYVALTTAPIHAASLDYPYIGIYAATHAGASIATWLARAQIKLEKNVTEISHSATEKRFYPAEFKDHYLTLWGVYDDVTIWDELYHSTITSEVVLTTRSPNFATDAKYITFNCNNVAWEEISASGMILEGDAIATSKGSAYVFMMRGKPQTIDVAFSDVATGVFATHYPAPP